MLLLLNTTSGFIKYAYGELYKSATCCVQFAELKFDHTQEKFSAWEKKGKRKQPIELYIIEN